MGAVQYPSCPVSEIKLAEAVNEGIILNQSLVLVPFDMGIIMKEVQPVSAHHKEKRVRRKLFHFLKGLRRRYQHLAA